MLKLLTFYHNYLLSTHHIILCVADISAFKWFACFILPQLGFTSICTLLKLKHHKQTKQRNNDEGSMSVEVPDA